MPPFLEKNQIVQKIIKLGESETLLTKEMTYVMVNISYVILFFFLGHTILCK